jgi:hypothetical protein
MKDWILRPVLPILWIVVGIEISYLLGIIQPIDPALLRMLKKQGDVETVSAPSDGGLSFAASTRFYLRDAESTGYVSSDGVGVSFTERSLPSANIARRAFEEKIESVNRVIERGPLVDPRGRQVGTRVVGMSPTKYEGIEWAAVHWTIGTGVYSVESVSLQHALEFERSFRVKIPNM